MDPAPSKEPKKVFNSLDEIKNLEPIQRLDNTSPDIKPNRIININIGVLGHIDSGKTSLCRSLSTIASTAGFDKNPQSKERGITLDLGFSAFLIHIPKWFREKHEEALKPYDFIQFTLVDCPGHASLMKTIIGGASIIDFMMLVIDSQKLIQTQTAECIVLAEILMDKLIIAMNKVDLFPEGASDPAMLGSIKKLRGRFKNTKFGPYLPIVPVAAAPKEEEGKKEEEKEGVFSHGFGVEDLVNTILVNIDIPDREKTKQHFQFAIDHCFQIKGQGTVMTGTVLSGQVKTGDNIEIPTLKVQKKVKSMQMFRKPVQVARQGDRVGICVGQLDANSIERGLACTANTMGTSQTILACMKKIKFFTDSVPTKSKFHITLGHQTAVGLVHFFSLPYDRLENCEAHDVLNQGHLKALRHEVAFDFNQKYSYEDQLIGDPLPGAQKEESKDGSEDERKAFFAIIQLEKPILIQESSLLIGSKLDMDISAKQCRLAFYGQVLHLINDPEKELPKVSVMKEKLKIGKVDRINDPSNILIKELFAKETSPDIFVNLKISLSEVKDENGNPITGTILGTFGKSGKLKVRLDSDLPASAMEDPSSVLSSPVHLKYQKSIWQDKQNKIKNKFKFGGAF